MQKSCLPTILIASGLLFSPIEHGSAQFHHAPNDIDWRLCAGELRTPGDKPTLDERMLACTRILDERGDKESSEGQKTAHEFRGAWLEQKGDFDQAIAEYSKGPRYFLHFSLCRVYAAKHDFDQAITHCGEAGNLDLRGKLYFVIRKYGAAASDLLFAVDLSSGELNQALWRYIVHKRAELVGDPLFVSPAPNADDELDADALALNKTISGFQFIDLFLGRAQWNEGRRPLMDNPCDTSFFTGEFHLLNGRQLEAERSLQQVLDSCGGEPKRVGVYLAAEAELERIGCRQRVEATLNALHDAEADRLCNARRYERSEARRDKVIAQSRRHFGRTRTIIERNFNSPNQKG